MIGTHRFKLALPVIIFSQFTKCCLFHYFILDCFVITPEGQFEWHDVNIDIFSIISIFFISFLNHLLRGALQAKILTTVTPEFSSAALRF